jgi:hypothetical protein
MDAAAPTAVPRSLRFLPVALATALALMTALFVLHAANCAACSTPSDDHAASTRATVLDILPVRNPGAPRSRAASGASGMLKAAHDTPEFVPLRLASAGELHRFADIDRRNTALAHRAITVLLI